MLYTALIGFPTSYSLSPGLYRLFASEFGLEYAHIKLNIDPARKSLREVIKSVVTLEFAGLNVTMPYKLAVIELLDSVDPFAAKIGAVNTIQIQNGRLSGSNTDHIGVRRSVEMARQGPITAADRAVIFGTGGAARSCAGTLLESTQNVCVLYRDPPSPRTQDFSARFSGELEMMPINSDRAAAMIEEATIICNATPVGMAPDIHSSIFPALGKLPAADMSNRVVFDAVYTPYSTTFLKQAQQAGFITADGREMMIYQGVEAFRIWTGKVVSDATIAKARLLFPG